MGVTSCSQDGTQLTARRPSSFLDPAPPRPGASCASSCSSPLSDRFSSPTQPGSGWMEQQAHGDWQVAGCGGLWECGGDLCSCNFLGTLARMLSDNQHLPQGEEK